MQDACRVLLKPFLAPIWSRGHHVLVLSVISRRGFLSPSRCFEVRGKHIREPVPFSFAGNSCLH